MFASSVDRDVNTGPVTRNCLRQWFQTFTLSFTSFWSWYVRFAVQGKKWWQFPRLFKCSHLQSLVINDVQDQGSLSHPVLPSFPSQWSLTTHHWLLHQHCQKDHFSENKFSHSDLSRDSGNTLNLWLKVPLYLFFEAWSLKSTLIRFSQHTCFHAVHIILWWRIPKTCTGFLGQFISNGVALLCLLDPIHMLSVIIEFYYFNGKLTPSYSVM